jgi:FtsP/CotA-like multicopper oxidase with cupredoxin domain
VIGIVATVALLAPLVWLWADSLVPNTYSVMGMGYPDYGGGPGDRGHDEHGQVNGWDGPPAQPGDVSVADLTGPQDAEPDVAVTLTARREEFTLPTGERVDGYTLNGTSPGPEIRVIQGQLVEVNLVNESVPDGITLHWHGVDVPNAEDGVAGVTQDALAEGESHVYRFVAEDTGTYWYHSHQVAHTQVRRGLFGTLVVVPPDAEEERDVVAAVHTYDGVPTIGGRSGVVRETAPAGEPVRIRVVNTDDSLHRAWVAGAGYRVLAVDGRDINEPGPVDDAAVPVAAGGRVDLEVQMPDDGSAMRVYLGATSLVLGPAAAEAPTAAEPERSLDLLAYGSPTDVGFDPAQADRSFEYRISRLPGFLDGRPGIHWAINGRLFPDLPMYVVAEGDIVRMRIENSSGDGHPMHLHGHHAVVLSRDGIEATGSPWWTDSLEVAAGETYEIAFVADNPGVWMDHCHNLDHAADGMIGHLAYTGVSEPFRVGGDAENEPE